MLGLVKKTIYPVGIELGRRELKMAQLGLCEDGAYLHAAIIDSVPEDVEFGSAKWQHWAISAVKEMIAHGEFSGKEVMTAIAADDIFIEQFKISGSGKVNINKNIHEKMAGKLPFNLSDAIIKYVSSTGVNEKGESEVIVMASHRRNVDRQLAIYENAGLVVKGIAVWPMAMTNCYVRFFGRRESDVEMTSMLMTVDQDYSNIVICKHTEVLFARTIPIGIVHFSRKEMVTRLMSEIDACCRYFESIYSGKHVERLVFFSGRSVNEFVCEKISELAQRIHVPAQIGDVLAAVDTEDNNNSGVDRRGSDVDWSLAFGLSLSGGD
jgi:Tfp pilus assembly PilM family ATPase